MTRSYIPNENEEKIADELYATIGRYVITFQWIEAKISECLMLLWGSDNWTASQKRLARFNSDTKIKTLWKEFLENPTNATGRARKEWVEHFEALIERLHDARHQRNRLLHSYYLFDFIRIGSPVLQVDPQKEDNERNHWLDTDQQKHMLATLYLLSVEVSQAHLQLVHDQVLFERKRDTNAT